MDFALEAPAAAVAEATEEVVGRLQPDWTAKFAESGFDREAWSALAGAGLTVLALPESCGGDELTIDALAPLVTRAGRGAVVTPLVGTLAATVLLADAPEAAERWAPDLAGGGWFAVALGETGLALGDEQQLALSTTAPGTGAGRTLTGRKTGVCFAEGAVALVVGTADATFLIDPKAPGVTLTRTPSSSGAAEYTVDFDGVGVADADLLASDSRRLAEVYRALLACYGDGLLAGALALTAEHVTVREQFGKPIAVFQAVGQQLADIYVVARTLNLIATAATWRLSAGLDAAQDVATASWWLAAEAPAALRTMTHLHGGIGVDVTYPLHRYFSLAKDLARLTGGPHATLDVLAEATVTEVS